MQSNLEDQAIKSALAGNWTQAIEINQQILSDTPDHIPTLNRLARALAQTGNTNGAIALYQQVLVIDKYNPIAQKQCSLLKKSPCFPQEAVKITMTDFVEEPGKTKTYDLVRLGDAKLLSSLQPGQEVKLVVKNHWILITSSSGSHIGCLPDDISFMLKQKLSGGTQFEAVIRAANIKHVAVFIREIRL
jgi:tetratricopeptide (TPR) repeat protein